MVWPVNPDIGLVSGLAVWGWMVWWCSRALAASCSETDPRFGRSALLKSFWTAAILKVGIIVVWYLAVGGYEINDSVGDSAVYETFGWSLAQDFREGNVHLLTLPDYLRDAYPGYFYWVALIYAFFGRHPLLVSLFNVLLSLWMAVLLYQVSLVLFEARTAKFTLVGALFYPQWISASYLILKDVATSLLVTLAVWSAYVPRRLEVRALAFMVSLLLLSVFRAPLAVMLGILGLGQFALVRTEAGRPHRRLALAMVLVAFVVLGTSVKWSGVPLFEMGFTTGSDPAEAPGLLAGTRLTFTWDSVEKIGGIVVSSPGVFIRYGIEAVIRFLYGPFFLYAREGPSIHPYDPGEGPFRSVLESLSGVFMGVVMPMIAMGWWECLRRRPRQTFLLSAWLITGVITLILTGVIVRWRLPFIIVAFIFAGLGCNRFKDIQPIYWAYFIAYVFLMGANATLQQDLVIPKAAALTFGVLLAWRLLASRVRRV